MTNPKPTIEQVVEHSAALETHKRGVPVSGKGLAKVGAVIGKIIRDNIPPDELERILKG